MFRGLLVLFAATLVLAAPVTAGSSGRSPASAAGVTASLAGKITLRGREGDHGPWRRYLWLKLVKTDVITFSVCAVWNQTSLPPSCRATRGKRLPEGTTMRLEQRTAAGRSARGWRTVGVSTDPSLQAVLSNTVSGNRLGAASYRVTLRSASRRVLATSNVFKVFWSR